MIDLGLIVGFQWDDGNARKSLDEHGVKQAEAEQVFVNEPLIIAGDDRHSGTETRFQALGKTYDERQLHITFTLRAEGQLIRIISSRAMNRKERKIYEQS